MGLLDGLNSGEPCFVIMPSPMTLDSHLPNSNLRPTFLFGGKKAVKMCIIQHWHHSVTQLPKNTLTPTNALILRIGR